LVEYIRVKTENAAKGDMTECTMKERLYGSMGKEEFEDWYEGFGKNRSKAKESSEQGAE
jgi:hypothetical protein